MQSSHLLKRGFGGSHPSAIPAREVHPSTRGLRRPSARRRGLGTKPPTWLLRGLGCDAPPVTMAPHPKATQRPVLTRLRDVRNGHWMATLRRHARRSRRSRPSPPEQGAHAAAGPGGRSATDTRKADHDPTRQGSPAPAPQRARSSMRSRRSNGASTLPEQSNVLTAAHRARAHLCPAAASRINSALPNSPYGGLSGSTAKTMPWSSQRAWNLPISLGKAARSTPLKVRQAMGMARLGESGMLPVGSWPSPAETSPSIAPSINPTRERQPSTDGPAVSSDSELRGSRSLYP